MKKRILPLALALVVALGVSAFPAFPATPALAAAPLSARPTSSTVLVDGENVAFDAYNINDNNYFKLRDLAFTLNGTVKQFAVGWDGENNAISLTSGQGYAPDGSEMKSKGAGNKTPSPTTSKIYLDGKDVQFTAYNIEGNNYFKLRDIGEAFNFGVTWDGARNTIVIDTSIGYTPEGSAASETQPSALSDLGKKLVGMWDATIQAYDEDGDVYGDGSFYLELKGDGTFKQLKVGQAQALAEYRSGVMALTYGNWHESGGSIYFTNCQFTSWDAYQEEYEKDGFTPVNMQPWKSYNDFIAKSIIHYPEGTAPFTIEEGFTSDEWGGMVIAPKLHRRIKMPPGSIDIAFDSRFVP